MNRRWIPALFVLLALIQLAIPLGQIWSYEDTLKTGKLYKFLTAPVDPSDAFRGKYVALNFKDTFAPVHPGDSVGYRHSAYVGLEEGPDGFAKFTELRKTIPEKGDYLRVKGTWGDAKSTNFNLPFDRFYMEEASAPKAEEAYFKNGNRRNQTGELTYVVVRVKGGRGVIEDLFLKGKPIREVLKADRAE